MKLSARGLMNRSKVDTRLILFVLIGLGFLSVVLAATLLAAANNLDIHNDSNNINSQNDSVKITKTAAEENKILAVIQEIDTENKKVTLYDIDALETIILSYTGGTDILDQYGQYITMNKISVGMMVDAAYRVNGNKMTSMNISTRAWEYPGVMNLNYNQVEHVMKIASTKYKYNDHIFVLDGNEFVDVDQLAEQDVLTIWGYNETIWSITVTKGHGTVKLKDYEEYLDDNITIGYEAMMQITDDLAVMVREGTFNLTVENGLYSATKSIKVERNKVTYVSLADLGPVGPKYGEVSVEITPFGADLYIDGELTSYSDPIELIYGEHSINAILGGYTSFTGTIDVNSDSKTIQIVLPELDSGDDIAISETDTSSDLGGTEDNTDSTDLTSDTDTDNSDSASDEIVYSDEDTEYTLDAGESVDSKHNIYVKTPSGASVYLDGEYMGTAPCKFDKIIGTHVLTFIKEGYETMSYNVEVSDDNLDAYYTFPTLTKSE